MTGTATRDRKDGTASTVTTVWRFLTAATVLSVVFVPPAPAWGQDLPSRVATMQDGTVRLRFATRPGVCGNGRNIMIQRDSDEWERACEPGPAHVLLRFRDGVLVDVDTYVGGRWRPAGEDVMDLGVVSAPAAARLLLSLARDPRHRAGKDAIFPATIADSTRVWPDLLELARDQIVPRRTRKAALFWLGQAAGAAAMEDLADFVGDDDADLEVREAAVFALSQLSDDRGVPALIEIARTHDDPRIRRRALFWLGQSEDPRVLALFEEILLRR